MAAFFTYELPVQASSSACVALGSCLAAMGREASAHAVSSSNSALRRARRATRIFGQEKLEA